MSNNIPHNDSNNSNNIQLSIIIPTFQEEGTIGPLIQFLQSNSSAQVEIIVSDAGSTDQTRKEAERAGALTFLAPESGRAAQMNFGAQQAAGNIFYFVHADTLPPESFEQDILNAVQKGWKMGRYQTRFDRRFFPLQINEFFTRFNLFICFGGDQTLFITKSFFTEMKGYNPQLKIMEDFDLLTRATKVQPLKIFPKAAIVSSRKYDENSWWKVQRANYAVVKMFKNGASQNSMIETYRKMLTYRPSAFHAKK